MQIGKDTVVTLTYQLTTLSGELLEEATLESPAAYLHGGYDGIFPKVEESLEGKATGDTLDVVLEPDDAFGEYDAELVRVEPVHMFPKEIQVGMQLEAASEDGDQSLLYTVTDIAEGQVVVDGNHPLAGQSLRLQCQVREVRVALPVEVEHGHVHGEHGHHH
ncbi:MAG: peptidylprolyl isomerase [Pseudomonadota bacterium]|nr:peptidylprolyl isomerase [Pseudomonadota bacterium]MDP1902999.1 peptidylprolyl isomerase [Pseudomonadota bacterium]MDP2352229.1 peptidylprolyl isomerase [Pseudomonadota bacterium]